MKKILFTLLAGACLGGCTSPTAEIAIVPYPNSVQPLAGEYTVAGAPIFCDAQADTETQRVVGEFAERLTAASGVANMLVVSDDVPEEGIRFTVDDQMPAEAYRMEITKKGIAVRASAFPGFFYALQSLKQLLPAEIFGETPAPEQHWAVPCATIDDAPRFAYRGMMLDVARHFFSVEEVKRYIDMMAIHKLNTFHWHLTDDQGWRIEIKRYPRLTEVGSIRKQTMVLKEWGHYDGVPYGGFYTQDEIRDVVKYAAERAITIIPEIDLPGHMLSAMTAYPELGCTGGPYEVWGQWGVSEDVLCVGKEKTFEFLEGVLEEVMELFPSKYIHIGGDECPKVRWEKCPACQARIRQLGLKADDKHAAEHFLQSYVTARIEKFVNAHGRRIIGWDEILEGELAPDATVMSWRGSEGGIAAAKLGHDVIMTPTTHFYFDYYQSLDKQNEPFGIGGYVPMELVYSYDPTPSDRLTPDEQKHIIGVQANLWTEYIGEDSHLEYMLLPRMAALSEVQWCNPGVRDWGRFLRTFRMDKIYTVMGYNFAKHIFGVTGSTAVNPEKKCVEVTLTTQGNAPIYYTLDGSEPTAQSDRYTGPVAITRSCDFKAVALRENMSAPAFERTFAFTKSTCRPIVMNSNPTPKYIYGGALALVNGVYGKPGYTSGEWVGFMSEPLDATIDMQGADAYSKAGVEAYVEKGEWVFPPSEIVVSTSDNGTDFTEIARSPMPEESAESDDGVKRFEVSFPETSARYLRVTAKTVNPIPAWHGAAGQMGHMFISEIFVE